MKIKDYFHFYVGCQYQWQDGDGEWRKAQPLTAYQLSDVYRYHINARLILRPLSDMTDEEIRELFKHDEISKSYLNISYQKEIVMNNVLTGITINYDTITPDGTFSNSWTLRFSAMNAHDCKWLMSKGFDLFGLIDTGLAIDKTKL